MSAAIAHLVLVRWIPPFPLTCSGITGGLFSRSGWFRCLFLQLSCSRTSLLAISLAARCRTSFSASLLTSSSLRSGSSDHGGEATSHISRVGFCLCRLAPLQLSAFYSTLFSSSFFG